MWCILLPRPLAGLCEVHTCARWRASRSARCSALSSASLFRGASLALACTLTCASSGCAWKRGAKPGGSCSRGSFRHSQSNSASGERSLAAHACTTGQLLLPCHQCCSSFEQLICISLWCQLRLRLKARGKARWKLLQRKLQAQPVEQCLW